MKLPLQLESGFSSFVVYGLAIATAKKLLP